MANKNLTPVATWQTPQAPTAGDAATGPNAEACFQDAADRTQWLRAKAEAAVSGSADDAYGNIDSAVTGDTSWHDSTTITKTVAADIGSIVTIMLVADVLQNTTGGQGTTFRVKVTDSGTEYLDGAAQFVAANGVTSRVVLIGKHTMVSASAVFTLQLKQSAAGVSSQMVGGWNIVTL